MKSNTLEEFLNLFTLQSLQTKKIAILHMTYNTLNT